MKTNGKNKRDSKPEVVTALIQSPHIIRVPATEAEYDELVAILDYLLDTTDVNEDSPAAALVNVIGSLIEQYENIHIPELSDIKPKSKLVRQQQRRSRVRIPT